MKQDLSFLLLRRWPWAAPVCSPVPRLVTISVPDLVQGLVDSGALGVSILMFNILQE